MPGSHPARQPVLGRIRGSGQQAHEVRLERNWGSFDLASQRQPPRLLPHWDWGKGELGWRERLQQPPIQQEEAGRQSHTLLPPPTHTPADPVQNWNSRRLQGHIAAESAFLAKSRRQRLGPKSAALCSPLSSPWSPGRGVPASPSLPSSLREHSRLRHPVPETGWGFTFWMHPKSGQTPSSPAAKKGSCPLARNILASSGT